MPFSGVDCNDNPIDLFADLDAGKAVVLHFYMPDCGSCPPPAQKIQTMANNIMIDFPGMIKGYAFPFQNSTSCSYSASWVEDYDLPLFSPMDSGAAHVAHYGGFGMPTVVLLGGADHRVMFSTLSFTSSDTTEMADSILALFGVTPTAIHVQDEIKNITLTPNPANEVIELNFSLISPGNVDITITDINGSVIEKNDIAAQAGDVNRKIETAAYPEGIYVMRISANGVILSRRFTIIH